MYLTYSALLIATCALINAQNLPNVPQCSLNCITTAVTSDGCSSPVDFACHCAKPQLVSQITPCVAAACDATDQATVQSVLHDTCASAGVPLGASSSAMPASSSAEMASSSRPAASSLVAPTPIVSSADTSVSSRASSVPSSTASSKTAMAASATSTAAQFTAAAVPLRAQGVVGSLGVVMLVAAYYM